MQLRLNKKIRFMLYLLLPICLLSCEKPLSDYNPEYQERLVINSFLSPDSVFEVTIDVSSSIDEEIQVDSLFNEELPKVELWKNGSYYKELLHKGKNVFHLPADTPVVGANYTIKASFKDYSPVSASTSIPEPVKIKEAWYDTGTFKYPVYNDIIERYVKFSYTFKDPPNINNYYAFFLYYGNFPYAREAVYWNSNYGDVPILSDESFDGEEETIVFYPERSSFLEQYEYFTIKFTTLSEELFQYLAGSVKYTEPPESFFEGLFPKEPVPMYTNVKNGRGIFGGYSQDTIRIKGLE